MNGVNDSIMSHGNVAQRDIMSAADVLRMMSNPSIPPNRIIGFNQQNRQNFNQCNQMYPTRTSNNLMVMSQNSSSAQQAPMNYTGTQVMPADSTVTGHEDDPLTSFVETLVMNNKTGDDQVTSSIHNSNAMLNHNLIITQHNQMLSHNPVNTISNQMVNNHNQFRNQQNQPVSQIINQSSQLVNQSNQLMNQSSHFNNQNNEFDNQQHMNDNIGVNNQQMFNNGGGVPSFLEQRSQQTTRIPHPPNTDNEMYDFTLQWRNDHFGQKQSQQQQQHIEPDSTAGDIDDLMVTGFGALSTTSNLERPQSNMVINTMETLLSSFAEENKFFENQAYRYP